MPDAWILLQVHLPQWIGMSALGIANGILDIKEGDELLGWTEIIISVIFYC